jgi:hypothetical protein
MPNFSIAKFDRCFGSAGVIRSDSKVTAYPFRERLGNRTASRTEAHARSASVPFAH